MRRSKIGDVYAFRAERGYRLFQYAYKVDRIGKFYRVFPNFYSEIPENFREIVLGEYSYLIWHNVATGFRSGLFQFLGNVADRGYEPFPKYEITYVSYGKTGDFIVSEFSRSQTSETFESAPDGSGLPQKYRNVKLINSLVPTLDFIYLLSSGFDLSHWELFSPGKKLDEIQEKYGELLSE